MLLPWIPQKKWALEKVAHFIYGHFGIYIKFLGGTSNDYRLENPQKIDELYISLVNLHWKVFLEYLATVDGSEIQQTTWGRLPTWTGWQDFSTINSS